MVERTAVFIDGGYLDSLQKNGFRGKLDYKKLVEHAVGTEGRLLRAYYYACMPYQSQPPTKEENERYSKKDKFISKIRRFPRFEVVPQFFCKFFEARILSSNYDVRLQKYTVVNRGAEGRLRRGAPRGGRIPQLLRFSFSFPPKSEYAYSFFWLS